MKRLYWEIIIVFLRLGFLAFGGPAAHISMMEEEVVEKRQWISKKEFLDLIGFTNLIPGPNSTEMAIILGYTVGGKTGLFLAGFFFILPAMLIVILVSYLYVQFGDVTFIQSFFDYIQPVIVAIILSAVVKLTRTALPTIQTVGIFIFALILLFLGMSEIFVILISAIFYYIINELQKKKLFVVEPISLTILFLTFLKIGTVLYGSGYVLIAYIQSEFVEGLNALTQSQLLDAVAVGEFTPGPVFTTATFIGYILHGLPGSLIATAGIFLPSFLLVLILAPFFQRLRQSDLFSTLLIGINAASVALMAHVTITLGSDVLQNGWFILLFLLSFMGVYHFKINSGWFIIGALLLSLVF